MNKTVKWVISTILTIGLIVVAAMTCPGKAKHKRVVSNTIKKEIQRMYDNQKDDSSIVMNLIIEGTSKLEKWLSGAEVEKRLIVDDFWLFSVGSMTDSDGIHIVSLGMFDHVFVFPMYVRGGVSILKDS